MPDFFEVVQHVLVPLVQHMEPFVFSATNHGDLFFRGPFGKLIGIIFATGKAKSENQRLNHRQMETTDSTKINRPEHNIRMY